MPKNTPPTESNSSSDQLYLGRLVFDPKLRESWLNFFVSNFRVVVLLIILIIGWGVYAFQNLPRESNPEVKIPTGIIMTTFPGASPSDVEELITKKIEKKVAGVKGVDKITSTSANSVSSVSVQFLASEDLDDAIRRLRDTVDDVKPDLPDDANDPVVKEISFDDQPIWTVALTGPLDGQRLRSFAEDVQDELEKIDGVREVNLSGGEETEFEIAYDPAKLVALNISPQTANSVVKSANVVFPAGSFESGKFNYTVRSDGRFFDASELGKIPLSHSEGSAAVVYLQDVAQVTEQSIKKSTYARLSVAGNTPREAVTLSVVKKTGGSILDVVANAETTVDQLAKKLPGVEHTVVVDFSREIADNFEQLSHDFMLTVLLVGIVLFLIVGAKEAFVAGLAVPLVFCVSFGVMLMTGITLNFLSLFSLILSLGLLVDDAIVVVSATKQYLRSGKFTPEEAVLLVLRDFKVVLTTTTLTTVWAFLPLLMASGIIGEFIKSIPITASVTMISSLFIALMINHPLAAVLERIRLTPGFFFTLLAGFTALSAWALTGSLIWKIIGGAGLALVTGLLIAYRRRWREQFQANSELVAREWRDDELIKQKLKSQGNAEHGGLFDRLMHGILDFHIVLPYYEKFLRWCVTTRLHRLTILGVTFLVFISAVALPVTGIVRSEFFPQSDQDYLFVNLEGPVGLRLSETDKLIRQVEQELLPYKEIKSFATDVGTGGVGGSRLGSSSGGSHLAAITITLLPADERTRTSLALADEIRGQVQNINGARVTVESAKGGPPAGSAFQAQIIGEDLTVLDRVAHELKPLLVATTGAVDADISLKPSPAEYTFALDRAKCELLNVNPAYVGSLLRMAVSGTEVTTVVRGGDETKVIARFDEAKVPTLAALQNLQIVNTRGQPIFLKDVAEIGLTPSVEAISRLDQKRVVNLTAGAAAGASSTEMLAEFQQKLVESKYQLPAGYEITYGGENEENANSVASIIKAMQVALILIVATLVIQFNSFVKPFIVLITIPLALIGVFYGLALTQIPLSFPGLIGIVALFGIVVKNAIILVDKINLNLKSQIPFLEAIVDAGKSRLEAIVITSICTIFGILPVTLSDATWTGLGSSIIFGLMLSSLLTLFIIPILFVTLVKEE